MKQILLLIISIAFLSFAALFCANDATVQAENTIDN